jgi:hypothetical protein
MNDRLRVDIHAEDFDGGSRASSSLPQPECNVAAPAGHIKHSERPTVWLCERPDRPPDDVSASAKEIQPTETDEGLLMLVRLQCEIVQ